MAIIDFLDRGWRVNPNGAAYIMGERSYSFSEVRDLSCRIANGLIAAGLQKESKGAVWALNDPVAWTCTLGLWRAGLAWIPVNPRSSVDDNRFVLDSFDCEVVFFQKYFAPVISGLRPQLPKVRLWICIDDDLPDAPSLDTWSRAHSPVPPAIDFRLDDVVAIMPTGGTTGMPKGVMNTHRSIQTFVANYMIAVTYAGNERPVNLAAAPMTHTAGILGLPCTARGGTIVVLEKPDPALIFDAIARHRVTEFFLPPTVIYRLLEIPGIEAIDFSSLKYLMYGAAPMSLEKLKKAIEIIGPVMTGGYGQTECPGSISFMRPDEHFVDGALAPDERLASVGRPSPLISVEILDAENRILPRGESGEICVRGDLVMKGYYKQPDKTAETIIDGWLHTGDIGYVDAEGYLHITDRKKDMIITGGFNVYPNEVEQVIWAHPAVQDCAVIGVPDEKWGEAVKAVVELNPGQTVSAEELIAVCKERLGSVKAPKSIDFTATLPRSPVGKVLKKELREQYWRDSQRKI
ncbi:long-chain fatty acid--CoA ligase [Azoarcus sp. KH32C]|uniref:acyl-CoA synthetase n=1 Tax=Azoarcus sp. KH32C TaxID=748247 RepID=UPI000238682F|nr:long-chain fatty acid--CoA ligase [Azoarcus sp. KH32C]BAL24244.1 AMP-dependent synthetase and ligase [Azoarcus sp. KH32C]